MLPMRPSSIAPVSGSGETIHLERWWPRLPILAVALASMAIIDVKTLIAGDAGMAILALIVGVCLLGLSSFQVKEERARARSETDVLREANSRQAQVEQSLRASEKHYRSLIETSPDAIAVTDLEGRICQVNRRAAELFLYSTDEILGKHIAEMAAEEEGDRVAAVLRERANLEVESGYNSVYQARRSDGSLFPAEVSSATVTDDHGRAVAITFVAHDISERMQREEALREREQRYHDLFQNAGDIVFTIDLQGNFTSINRMAERLTGYSEEVALALNMADVIVPESLDQARRMIADKLAGGESTTYELSITKRDGGRLPIEVNTQLLYRDGRPIGVQGIGRDVSERRRFEAALEHQALHDALTDLPNRTLLNDRLRQAVLSARRTDRRVGLLLMDLDGFKEINDTFGHHYGDLLLSQTSTRLRQVLREPDTVARLGGDEFAVVLPEAELLGAVRVANKIQASLAHPFPIDGHRLTVEASIGIALFPEHGDDSESLLRRADVSMYVAKRSHRGIVVYESEHDQHQPERLDLIEDLRQAIHNGQLSLNFQPRLRLSDGDVNRVEALARWHHPVRGMIAPDEFIPLAEQTGLIKPLTLWVLNEALRWCRAWRAAGSDVMVAINLSAQCLLDRDLTSTIATNLAHHKLDPSVLAVEVTESAVMADVHQAMAILQPLHEMGVRVSIDDFGTGYSSLAYLKQIPAAEVKIDRSFVSDMANGNNDEVIVRAVIDLGHNLGLAVIAEGVERRDTWDTLAAMGCDGIQGYYLSQPLPAGELLLWLRQESRRSA
ncbi:MAG: putative bifunctional diguanylate cyclase/phosphodiesterase [Chloroflexota bacterium]